MSGLLNWNWQTTFFFSSEKGVWTFHLNFKYTIHTKRQTLYDTQINKLIIIIMIIIIIIMIIIIMMMMMIKSHLLILEFIFFWRPPAASTSKYCTVFFLNYSLCKFSRRQPDDIFSCFYPENRVLAVHANYLLRPFAWKFKIYSGKNYFKISAAGLCIHRKLLAEGSLKYFLKMKTTYMKDFSAVL